MTTPSTSSGSAVLRTDPVTLREVARALGAQAPAADPVIRDVTHDSRQAAPGVLFACRPGTRTDGHDHAPAAVAAGAPALLVERELDLDVPQVRVASVADAMGHAAALVHGHPSSELALVGVTGTNGKTTTTYLVEAILAAAGRRTGLVGTIETRIAGERVPGVRTTPESTDLQRLLRRMRDAGVTAAAMEVSSHGLVLGRVTGTRFSAAAFTNLSQDHLDFHRDLEDYFAAKARLFDGTYTDLGIVNVDDHHGRILAERAPIRVLRLSARGADADIRATDVEAGTEGATFTAHLTGGSARVRIALPGRFNVANALTAMALAEQCGVAPDDAAAALATAPGVPGRMEPVDAGQPFGVVVDYAHTPDSLDNVLEAARDVAGGRVLVVIGCGGDRDRGKRPLMGAAAVRGADLAVLTSDNPRSEDPHAILAAMEAGARQASGGRYVVEPDRRSAIALALAEARPGDLVVIAGKGHEAVQEVGGRTVPFDDRLVARELLADGEVDG